MGDAGDLNSRLEIAASSSTEEAELRYSAEVLSGSLADRQQIQLAALCTAYTAYMPAYTSVHCALPILPTMPILCTALSMPIHIVDSRCQAARSSNC